MYTYASYICTHSMYIYYIDCVSVYVLITWKSVPIYLESVKI